MRLLIAEDERDLAEALTVFFEKNQFSVDTVNDGLSAYEYASSGEYDAIILDVMMPKLSGIGAAALRGRENTCYDAYCQNAEGGSDNRVQCRSGRLSAKTIRTGRVDLPCPCHAPEKRGV